MSIYNHIMKDINGNDVPLDSYRGKVLIIVNTASKCGLTPQYEGLQELYDQYHDQGLEILGFPSNQFAGQEPGGDQEIKSFCSLRYDVSFPLFSKTLVRGQDAHPLFKELSQILPFEGFNKLRPDAMILQAHLKKSHPEIMEGDGIKWNFNKFVIDREGNPVQRFEPYVKPKHMKKTIEKLL